MAQILQTTPLPIIASVTRVITKAVDRITGDRNDFPNFVCLGVVYALKKFNIESSILYGEAAWIECLTNRSLLWAGAWGENHHFWVVTQFNETVDLTTSVSYRKSFSKDPAQKPILSPPLLWSIPIPIFYRYRAIGIAEIEPTLPRDLKWRQYLFQEIDEKILPENEFQTEYEFPNEALLCPNKKLIDDSRGSFIDFDQAIQKTGLPHAPF